MSRAEKAKEYFMQGYACSQAVAMAFSDLTEFSERQIAKMSLPFGSGLGRQRLTCGAVSAMALVIGLTLSKDENSGENKNTTYAMVREVCARFKERNGSIICEELLRGSGLKVEVGGQPEARTNEYYKKRPCPQIVYIATEILEEYLSEKGVL